MNESKPVTYRFGLRDRTGWLLGLTAGQCVALALGVLGGGALLNAGAPAPLIFVPLLLAAGYAFGTWGGRPVHTAAPTAAQWAGSTLTGRQKWRARLPRWRADGATTRTQPELPPCLDGITIEEADGGWTARGRSSAAGIVRDRVERTWSVVLRVSGREFALCEQSEQQRLLALWGDALGGFCAERGPVARFRWIEWAAPAGLDDQLQYLRRHQAAAEDSPAVGAYRRLLDNAGPMATRHEVLAVVTVSERKLRRRRDGGPSAQETLLEEVRLLCSRLETAGLSVDMPLSPSELAAVLRTRLDPHASALGGTGKRSLAQLAGLISVHNAGPLSMETHFSHSLVDRSVHAAYVVAEWPRLEVPPNWMEPLLLHNGGIRTVVVHYEPVPHSRSQRQIDRDSVKLAADEEQRQRQGFRIGARHRRAQVEIADREAELVAGYPEFEFIGTVHMTAPDVESLERSCAEYEQVAAQVGIELRRLDGQHDLALPCMLPIGRGIAGKRGLA
ncbi:MAG: SCO6880 family protein [Acidimicrobiia bacterium]